MTFQGVSSNSKWEDVGKSLSNLLQEFKGVSLIYAKVESVDEEERTMNAVMNDEHTISGISLDIIRSGNNGVLLIPAIDSMCVLGFIENQPEQCVIIQLTKVDKIIIINDYEQEDDSYIKIDVEKIDIKRGETICTIEDKNITLENTGGMTLKSGDDGFNAETSGGMTLKSGDDKINIDSGSNGIVLNGGSNGGLIKINQLTQKLNALVNAVNSLRTAYMNHTHNTMLLIPPAASPAPFPSLPPRMPPIPQMPQQFNAKDYENDKVKQ